MKKKKLKLIPLAFLLLFSGYVFYKNITYKVPFRVEAELTHQKFIRKMPQTLRFADEQVHFKNPEAYRRFYQELKYHTHNDAYTRQALRNAGKWFPVIEKILKEHKLPQDLKYLALAESNLTNARSPMGAAGFWQFTKASGSQMGLVINEEIDERLDPVKSTHAACRYLKRLYAYFGSWSSAAAAYNLGETALYFAFRNQRVNSYYDLKLNRETAGYLYRIIALKDLVEHTSKYGMSYKRYSLTPTRTLAIKKTVPSVVELAKKNGITYQQLHELNPWVLGNKITLKDSTKQLFLKLPI